MVLERWVPASVTDSIVFASDHSENETWALHPRPESSSSVNLSPTRLTISPDASELVFRGNRPLSGLAIPEVLVFRRAQETLE